MFQHVVQALGEVGALADQVVGTAAARVERAAGDGVDLAAGFQCKAGGDEAAGAKRRLDHHDAEAEAGDDAVAAGKVAGQRRGAERRLGHHGAALGGDAGLERGVLRRVGLVEAAGDGGDGTARMKGAEMRGGVDAAGHAGDHGEVGAGHALGQILGEAAAGGGGVAGADHGDRAEGEGGRVAQQSQDRRRIVQRRQQRRVAGPSKEQELPAKPRQRRRLPLHGALRRHDERAAAVARQRGQCGAGAAETLDQPGVGLGADALGPRQAQPVERIGRVRDGHAVSTR